MIIDVHMHLGNFLRKNGKDVISKHIEMPQGFNIQRFEEDVLHFKHFTITDYLFQKYDDYYTFSVRNRIKAGTYQNLNKYYSFLEHMSQRLFNDSTIRTFCMPIAPYVTFQDIYPYSVNDNRLLSFNSIDLSYSLDMAINKLIETLPYCYGLKLHPIIQGIPFNSECTYRALDIFKGTGKPVLLHAGASRYFLGKEKRLQHCELDNPFDAKEMISRYPDIPFIVGHAGIAEYKEWAELLHKYENVYVDITVQSVSTVKELIQWYGEDKLLFATDWPCVNPKTTMGVVLKALDDNQVEKILYKNALSLFGKSILEGRT